MRVLWIGAAGFVGAIARYALDESVTRRADGRFPWGTLIVNVTGSFVLGVLFALFTQKWAAHPNLRAALTTGFLGAYTTFSTFSLQTVRLVEEGAVGLAGLNIVASLALGLAFVYAGLVVGRAL